MADNKFSITKTNPPLSDISQIPTPESRPTDGLRNSLKVTEWDVDDEFPPIQVLLVRYTEVIDLTGEDPPLGQPESPCQQLMAETGGHSQGTADILSQLVRQFANSM